MSPDEIERLRVKIEKDPNSRLFLPLAEEYRKSGMPDEAVSVLQLGLKRNPGYTSAMVALGRIYLEKNMLNEARAKFEEVITVVTGNLFAHRKLADIYMELGETEKAIAEYREVLRLNPKDEEVSGCIEVLEAAAASLSSKIAVTVESEPLPGAIEASQESAHILRKVEIIKEEDSFFVQPALKDIDAADSFVAAGEYYKAAELYRNMLAIDPANRYLMQRLVELKALLKLLGRGEEVLIARLEDLLEGIKKRGLLKAGRLTG